MTVREYLAALPTDARRRVKELREIVRASAPDSEETISYGIPALKVDGRPLVYYAGWKSHVSLYPITGAIRQAHAAQLQKYKTSKGTVQFPLDKPLPVTLVKRLVKARMAALKNAKR